MRARRSLRVSAALHAFTGVASVLVMPPILLVAVKQGELPVVAGVRVMSGGPFERLGLSGMVILGWLFVGIGALETLVARRMWRLRPGSAQLATIVNVAGAPFWIGFALPLWPPLAAIRLVLAWFGREAQRTGGSARGR